MSAQRPRALFLMPPFSRLAGRRDPRDLEDFFNPCQVFERVVLLSLDDPSQEPPERIGSLRIVPVEGPPRPRLLSLGERLYRRLDPVLGSVLRIARAEAVDLLVQRYGGPLWHGLPIVIAAHQLGLPSIVTLQADYWAQTRLEGASIRWRRSLMERAAWRRVLGRSTRVWAVSEFLRDRAIERGVHRDRIVALPNKDRISRFERVPAESEVAGVFEVLGLPRWREARPLLLAVGRLIPQKNFRRLLEAMARARSRCPASRLLIVGQGPLESAIRERIASLGLAEQVALVTTYLSLEQLRVLYHTAGALLFCSLHEGQGRVVYEAMACGTPVMGSDLGPIPEMVVPEVNGLLVDPREPELMARAIERICRGELERAAVREACVETARRFDLSRIGPLEAELYASVLKER